MVSLTSRRGGAIIGLLAWVAFAAIGTYIVWPLKDRPRRGIDLVGGYYITLKVNVDAAVKAELTEVMQSSLKAFSEAGLNEASSSKIENHSLMFTFKDSADAIAAADLLKSRKTSFKITQDIESVVLEMQAPQLISLKEHAVNGNVEILRKRLNSLGVAEIPVSRQGDVNISIELPAVEDSAAAKKMIGTTSHLEIKPVEAVGATEDDLLDKYDGVLPEGMMIVESERDKGEQRSLYYLVPDYTDLTGKDLRNAFDSLGGQAGAEPVVNFEFSSEGGDKFYDLTNKSIGKQVAIIIDNKVICAPRVASALRTSGYIHGNFDQSSAQNLATMLRSGAFVAPVTFEEERRIGPSLGAESIQKGVFACLIGLLALFLFSIICYKVSGLFAFITLLYNLLLILFAMYWINATLTLPGIAGLVLTLGMAIDSSVLIYERIRESLKDGVTFKKAVDIGFSDAMSVILDGNITTFLAGVVLYKFGTGPIQGFAVTLMLGILATLVTGLFFLRSLFNAAFALFNVDRISI